jgi:site-specific DNA-methyltransferase (adenine-specific)
MKVTKGTTPFEGYGTQLKPAYEPIIVAMKPNDGNFVNNALKWGVAGLNIDAGRIDFRDEEDYNESTAKNQHEDFNSKPITNNVVYGDYSMLKPKNYTPTGRFPANVIFDEEAGKVLDEQSGISKSQIRKVKEEEILNKENTVFETTGYKERFEGGQTDKGGASRFFYCAKASKSERNAGCEELEEQIDCDRNPECYSANVPYNRNANPKRNTHPTVKPLKLMEYLCKITRTPTGGIVLDPFLGSGTTAVACIKTNRNFIGIEREADYIKIAEARIAKAKEDKI